SFHVEVAEGGEARQLVARAHALGMGAGLVINPPTPVERIVPLLDAPDLVLVMSVNPGFSGQSFIRSALDKARVIKPRLRPTQRLELDGGITVANAHEDREAGGDVIVAAYAVFKGPRGQSG